MVVLLAWNKGAVTHRFIPKETNACWPQTCSLVEFSWILSPPVFMSNKWKANTPFCKTTEYQDILDSIETVAVQERILLWFL